jgi:transcriptional regulator with XRE-family HTH domain
MLMVMTATVNSAEAFNAAIGDEIRAELARNKISISALADKMGVRRDTLSDKLNGHTKIQVRDVLAIASALGLSMSELFVRAERSLSETVAA